MWSGVLLTDDITHYESMFLLLVYYIEQSNMHRMTCAVSHGNLFRHVHVICFAMSQTKKTTN